MDSSVLWELHLEQIPLYIIGFGLCGLLIKYMKWTDVQQLYFYLCLAVITFAFIYYTNYDSSYTQ